MIECRNLTVAFQNKTILDRINLTVQDGAFLCLNGVVLLIHGFSPHVPQGG